MSVEFRASLLGPSFPSIAGDLLGERARLTPDKTALIYVPTQERFTYRELNERAVRCVRAWHEACRLERGDRVGILAHNSVEFLDAFFAAGKSGIILVPLNTRLTPPELEYIISDSGLKALLYGAEFADTVQHLKREVSVRHWIAFNQREDSSDLAYGEIVAAAPPVASAPARFDPEDLHCLLYTSGTTGRPKGVMVPQRMVLWNAYSTVLSWQLREDDVGPIFTPLFHAGGLGVFLTPIVAVGGTVVLHRNFDAGEIWRTIERERCSVIFGVPTIFKLLLEAPEFATVDLHHVRWFISGGAPSPQYLIEEYQKRGIAFKQGYGLTEVGVNCFAMTTEESLRKPGSIGKPLLFTEAKLVDQAGNVVAVGEVGELLLRGPHVSKGYWNNSEATAAVLDQDGWFRTGDLARRDEEGFFYIVGRCKEMFISGGENVYPAEIEQVLLHHRVIQDAAVVGVPHPTWGEVGVAYVVTRTGCSVAADEINQFLGARLAKYKLPKEFFFVESLPCTPYGKILKGELLERYYAAKQIHPTRS